MDGDRAGPNKNFQSGKKPGPGEATRWKKGQSGNPKGRKPNAECLTAILRREIEKIPPGQKRRRTWAELLVLATMRLACEGNSRALQEIWERLDGKVRHDVDAVLRSSDGGPVRIVVDYADRADGE